MCDNSANWSMYFSFGNIYGTYKENKTMYSDLELATVELKFIFGSDANINSYHEGSFEKSIGDINLCLSKDKERNFKGLCAVVEYLCELDNIPNIMDYTSLFETKNDAPKKELIFI